MLNYHVISAHVRRARVHQSHRFAVSRFSDVLNQVKSTTVLLFFLSLVFQLDFVF